MTGTVLTNNGLALITKLVVAKATLEFSRVAVGTGKVPQGVDPQAMINLNAYKMDAQISSYGVSPDQEDVAYIVTQVSSIGVSAGFAVTEGGVFANDPDKGEILFAYLDLTEDPQYVYAETDSISKFVEITFNVLIGSVEKVTAYVTPGALVKKVEFEELEKRVEETENPTFEDYTGDTSVPAASTAIEELKSKSKLGALLSNIKAAFKGACLIGHIVNNCVTDNPNLPLSAAQGKALMDLYNVLNTKTKTTSITLDKGDYLYNKLYVKKCGNIVQVFIDGISKLPSLKYTVLATLPDGYRPKMAVSWSCLHPDGRTYRIIINTDGEIIGYNYATDENNTNAVNTFTFVID